MKLIKDPRHYLPPVVTPAGRRADRTGRLGIPIPSRDSVFEEYQWVREHQL